MALPPIDPIAADPELGPLVRGIHSCLCQGLTDIGRPVCGCACCLVWGDTHPPADFCDCDDGTGQGQAWVSVSGWAPRESSARRDPVSTRRSNCYPTFLRVVLQAGVYRCAPAGGPNGEPPTCEERDANAMGLIADSRALRKLVFCCPALKGKNVTFGGGWPLAVRGGCTGTYVQFSVDLDRTF